MKEKHYKIRVEQCLAVAKASACIKEQVGALLVDPERNVVLMDGYNGGPRGGSVLCGEDGCSRDKQWLEDWEAVEIGCHHAEMNVICNCAAAGVSTKGAWLFVTQTPCVLCIKLLHHAGIEKVIVAGKSPIVSDAREYMQQSNIGLLLEYVEKS